MSVQRLARRLQRSGRMKKRVSGIRRAVLAATLVVAAPWAFAQDAVQSLDAIRAAAQSFVRKHLPKAEPGATQVSVGALDPRLRLARCEAELTAALPAGGTFRARMTIAVSCPEGNVWTIYVPVTIETRAKVLVLRGPAARGARLGAADVEVQERVVGGSGDSLLTDVAQLEGHTLKRPLASGTALTADVLVEDVMVKRGQSVTLLASASGIEVRAPGRAMADGRAAGRIKVQNLNSLRVVEGVVESADVIRVSP
jgi:flagella basal body P-ring formation protein FlgA